MASRQRKTLGQILKEVQPASEIPDVQNLSDSEAAAWLLTPQREGDAPILLDGQQDLRSDLNVPNPKEVAEQFADDRISVNKSTARRSYVPSIFGGLRREDPDGNASPAFDMLKRSSLQENNGAFGQDVASIATNVSEAGTSVDRGLTFLQGGTIANEVAKKAAESKLNNSNLNSPEFSYIDYNSPPSEEEERARGLYALKTYQNKRSSASEVNDNFDRTVAADPNNRMTADKSHNATIEMLLKNSMVDSDINPDDFEGKFGSLTNFVAPPVFPFKNVEELRVKYGDKFQKILADLNANDDILKAKSKNVYLSNTDRINATLTHPYQYFDGVPLGLITTAFVGSVSLAAAAFVYQLLLKGINSEFVKGGDNAIANFTKVFLPGLLFRSSNELGTNFKLNLEFESGAKKTANTIAAEIQKELQDSWWMWDDFYEGFKTFYGFYDRDGEGAVNIIIPFRYNGIYNSPGYYANIGKRIIADVGAFGSILNNFDGNPFDGANNSLVSIINSFTFSLFTRMVLMGMQKRFAKNRMIKIEKKESNIEDIKQITYQRNSYKSIDARNPLSVQNYSSMLLASKTSLKLHNNFTQFSSDPLVEIQDASSISETVRFSKEQVEEIEKTIDQDYVPFSIQDVRTNEIISLPAFIDSITDGFSVSYDTTNGFGRTDPIYTYSKTDRNIGINFSLVSFNPEDHDRIYHIINRLVSMCYPQHSRGEERYFGEGINQKKFIQPFSQIQTASPLVRLRLGDLIASNKSTYALKSLFGDNRIIPSTEVEQRKRKINRGIEAGDKLKLIIGLKYVEIDPITRKTETKAISKESKIAEVVSVDNNLKLIQFKFVDETAMNLFLSILTFSMSMDEKNLAYVLPLDDTSKNDNMIGTTLTNEDFEANNNPVVRSFDSTHGKGLAGFITQLNLEYDNAKGWGTTDVQNEERKQWSENLRAPMHAKISITFAPIHDLPLGLDHRGRIIAPSHPVGSYSSNVLDS